MDNPSNRQTAEADTKAGKGPLKVRIGTATVIPANERTRAGNEAGLTMLVSVIPRDDEMPGFVRGYN